MFEKYNVPAFFLVKNAVLAAFANGMLQYFFFLNCINLNGISLLGKSTALVVDSGATHTSAVPVLDGYALVTAAVRSSLGGDHLAQQARNLLTNIGAPLIPATYIQVSFSVSVRYKRVSNINVILEQRNRQRERKASLRIETVPREFNRILARIYDEAGLKRFHAHSSTGEVDIIRYEFALRVCIDREI